MLTKVVQQRVLCTNIIKLLRSRNLICPRNCDRILQQCPPQNNYCTSSRNGQQLLFSYNSLREYSSRRSNLKDSKQSKKNKKVFLSDEELTQVIDVEDFRSHLISIVGRLKDNYIKNLVVRTSVGSIESLKVNYDNQDYVLSEIAQLSKKNPALLVVNMVTLPQAIPAVLTAVSNSGLNINPQQEGTTIYLPIPPITREHRENLCKNAKTIFTKTSDDLKSCQNDIIRSIRKKQGDFSEDLIYNAQQQVMKITQTYISECEVIMQKKQNELLGEK